MDLDLSRTRQPDSPEVTGASSEAFVDLASEVVLVAAVLDEFDGERRTAAQPVASIWASVEGTEP